MWFTFFKIHLDFDHFNFHTNCFAECSCKCALIFHKCIAVELLNIIFCFAMFLLLMIILATLNHDSRRGFCLRWIPWFYPIHPGDALVRERAASALGAWVEIGRQVFWGMWCRWKKFLPGVTWDSAWYRADELTFGVKFLEFDCGFLFPLTDSLQAVPDKPVSPQDSSFTVRLSITGILQLPHI